ncbi:MAG: hypothetical protein WCK96_16005, partial [Methylococcales bacterium]
MPRTHRYTPIGERCFGKHDWHAKGRTNVIGVLLAITLLTVTLFTGIGIYTSYPKKVLAVLCK